MPRWHEMCKGYIGRSACKQKGARAEEGGRATSDAGLTSVKERGKKGRQVLDFSSIKAPRNGPALVCLLHSVIGLGAASARLDLGSHAAVGSSVQQLGSWLCSLQEEIQETCFHGLPDHSVLPLGQTNGSWLPRFSLSLLHPTVAYMCNLERGDRAWRGSWASSVTSPKNSPSPYILSFFRLWYLYGSLSLTLDLVANFGSKMKSPSYLITSFNRRPNRRKSPIYLGGFVILENFWHALVSFIL